MKCKFCDGSGKDYWGLNGVTYPCPVCGGTGEYEPFDADVELDKLYPTEQTNEEWFCQLQTEEKAKWLSQRSQILYDCGQRDVFPKIMYEEDWEWWLKQPHHESVTNCNE